MLRKLPCINTIIHILHIDNKKKVSYKACGSSYCLIKRKPLEMMQPTTEGISKQFTSG